MQASLSQNENSIILGMGQLNVAGRNAKTAEETLKSSEKSFVIEQRPYIVVDENSPAFLDHPPIAGQQIRADVFLRNVGKTPAVQVVTESEFFPLRGKLVAKLTAEERKKATGEYITTIETKFRKLRKENEIVRKRITEFSKLTPGEDVAPTKTFFLTTQEPLVVSTDDFPLLADGELSLYIIGFITYADGYKITYTTEFCYFWFGPDPKSWHICDSHNAYR